MSRIRLAALVVTCLGVLVLPGSASAFGVLSSFGSFGEGSDQMEIPGGVEIAPDGTTYVADYGNERIDVYSPTGTFERAFGKGVSAAGGDVCFAECQSGASGGGAGEIYGPEDVAVGVEGNVFVADVENNRIDVFTPAGEFVRAFGSEVESGTLGGNVCTYFSGCQAGIAGPGAGEIARPYGVAIDSAGEVFVTDGDNERIDVFTPSGTFLRAFGKNVNAGKGDPNLCTTACESGDETGDAGAIDEPYSLAFAPDGNLYVTDFANARVDVFSSQGTFLFAFGKGVASTGGDVCTFVTGCKRGEEGGRGGELSGPTAIAVDPSGNVLVADRVHNRIQEFTTDGGFLRAFGQGVVNGAAEFQVCAVAAECEKGEEGALPGAISEPFGVAVAGGKVYVSEEIGSTARVEVFGDPPAAGEPGTPGGEGPPPGGPSGTPPASPPRHSPAPSNKFRIGKLKLNPRKGTATLRVEVPGAGSVSMRGKGIKPARAQAAKATTVTLTVRLTGKAKNALRGTGKATVRPAVTFTPRGGTSRTTSRTLRLIEIA